jgi:putative peptide maturation system protein
MSRDRIDDVVGEAIALLVRFRAERVPAEIAWEAIVGMRARHPGQAIDLIWERDSYVDRIHYDVLIGGADGTLSISYCADEDVPWPARGLQRVTEALVLRVNDEPVMIGQVVTSLDYAWHQLHIGRHLIDMSLIDQEIRDRKIQASDEALEAALTAFRIRRRLFSGIAVERWMAEHGVSEVKLEHHLRQDVARDELRRQVIGDACAAHFAEHRASFDRVQVAKIFVADREAAEALRRELHGDPERFLAVAQQQFLQGGNPGDLFATLRRGEIDAEQAALLFATEAGQVAAVLASGDGFEVVKVLRRIPAELDGETGKLIGDRLFNEWLGERRARARVEWYWGEADAAEVPAISL